MSVLRNESLSEPKDRNQEMAIDNIINDSNRDRPSSIKASENNKNRQFVQNDQQAKVGQIHINNNFQIINPVKVRQVIRQEDSNKSDDNCKSNIGSEQKRDLGKKIEHVKETVNKSTGSNQLLSGGSKIGHDFMADEESEREFHESLDLENSEDEEGTEDPPLKSLLESFRMGRRIC